MEQSPYEVISRHTVGPVILGVPKQLARAPKYSFPIEDCYVRMIYLF
jgi:hypothetical protein